MPGCEKACVGLGDKPIEVTPGSYADRLHRFGPLSRMPLNTEKKQELINSHQTHGTDTGSVEVQVAMLSERISQLTGHLQANKHDFSSKQGLLKMLGRRKSLLSYLKSQSSERYSTLIVKLGIRG